MKLTSSLFQECIMIESDKVTSLIIENQNLFLKILQELYSVTCGNEGDIILSENHTIMKASGMIELITTFVPFDINEKRLISKINTILEREALNEIHYMETMNLLSMIEMYMGELSNNLPCIIDYKSINITALIKMCGIEITDDSSSLIEKVFNYMMLVRELLGERLFIFVNMATFFSTEELQSFIETAVAHKFYVLLLDGNIHDRLEGTVRIIIDQDLCFI